MDHATVFLLYLVGVLFLWLVVTSVRPAIAAVSRIGVLVPGGRRLTAVVISAVLMLGMVRVTAATASVAPASHRLEEMVEISDPVLTSGSDAFVHVPGSMVTPQNHIVVRGDSLWGIARSVLSADGSFPTGADISNMWHSIYEMNKDIIGEDPNLILSGQVLQLPRR
jgi:nucleoid-associated protein YgaU